MTPHTPRNLAEARRYFRNSSNRLTFLVSRRWPNGVHCPQCGGSDVYFDLKRSRWECKTRHPKRTFTLKTGTIFEDSPLGFDKWLPALWLVANAREYVSSYRLARTIGVTQKTAWSMLQRITMALLAEKNERRPETTWIPKCPACGSDMALSHAKRFDPDGGLACPICSADTAKLGNNEAHQ